MKLLMLNYEFPPVGGGGGQAHRALLEQYAGRSDLDVDVVTSGVQVGLNVEPLGDNVRVHRVGIAKRDLHCWRRGEVLQWLRRAKTPYRRLLRQNRYDLVHAFFGFPSGWLCYRTRNQTPYIVSLRGSDVPGQNARLAMEYKILGPLVFKPIWRHATALVACSEGLKQRALRFVSSAAIEVIPNGVDLQRFCPAGAMPETDTGGPLRLLTVGRLSATKRVAVLIDMIEKLRVERCDVSLTIVGGGALESVLRGLVSEKGLKNVTLAGRRDADEMPRVYREHDVFVSATMQEGMSNAMLEAMASGLPIVTTRCEGVRELVDDNGIVVDASEPDRLAKAVRELALDREALRSMSIAARRRAERFTWSGTAHAYVQLYERVL
jgi:glycosyltransferase involved in cell wall biosynthesis